MFNECFGRETHKTQKTEKENSMKKRIMVFAALMLVVVMMFAALPSALAISRSHGTSRSSDTLKATAYMQPIACCGSSNVDVAKLQLKYSYRPILSPSSPVTTRTGSLIEWSGTTKKTTSASVNENNTITAASHLCYVHCKSCTDRAGSTASFH